MSKNDSINKDLKCKMIQLDTCQSVTQNDENSSIEQEVKYAENKIMQYLSRREHSKFELKKKLLNKNFQSEHIEKALYKLEMDGWQSDERFTQSFVDYKSEQGYGPIYLQTTLTQEHKIKDHIINKFLKKIEWRPIIKKLWSNKNRSFTNYSYQEYNKNIKWLYSRGFSLDDIRAAIGKYKNTIVNQEEN